MPRAAAECRRTRCAFAVGQPMRCQFRRCVDESVMPRTVVDLGWVAVLVPRADPTAPGVASAVVVELVDPCSDLLAGLLAAGTHRMTQGAPEEQVDHRDQERRPPGGANHGDVAAPNPVRASAANTGRTPFGATGRGPWRVSDRRRRREHPAGHPHRAAMVGSLGADERGHFCRPFASATQLPNVPSFTPTSRPTCATGLPDSNTIRTAPSQNSRAKLLLLSTTTSSASWAFTHYEGKGQVPWSGVVLRVPPWVLRRSVMVGGRRQSCVRWWG